MIFGVGAGDDEPMRLSSLKSRAVFARARRHSVCKRVRMMVADCLLAFSVDCMFPEMPSCGLFSST